MNSGVILAGGRSNRMGQDKNWLTVNGEPLLSRTVRVMSEVCSCVFVAAAVDQSLPALHDDVTVIRDATPFDGPLVGFAHALSAISNSIDCITLVSCDLPDLTAAFLKWIHGQFHDEFDAVVPVIDGQRYPLCGLYRSTIREAIISLTATGHRRFQDIFNRIHARFVTLDDIPRSLQSPPPWVGVNTPEEWAKRGGR